MARRAVAHGKPSAGDRKSVTLVTGEHDGVDRYGHGTHVASTIAGHRAPCRGVAAALATTVTGEPSSVVLGRHEWPHDDDVPATEPLVYRNDGTQPVTLDLAVRGTEGADRVFSVSPARPAAQLRSR